MEGDVYLQTQIQNIFPFNYATEYTVVKATVQNYETWKYSCGICVDRHTGFVLIELIVHPVI